MCHGWTPEVTITSLSCGLAIDTLLMVNNYRDREQDARSGKQTLVVRFGAKTGHLLYLGLGISASLLCLFFIHYGHFWAALLPQLYLPLHLLSWKRMVEIDHGRALNRILGQTSRNMLLFGILLSVGLIL